jgi:hypothetical protein
MKILIFMLIYLICFSGFVVSEIILIRKKFSFLTDVTEWNVKKIAETNENIVKILSVLERIDNTIKNINKVK